MGVNPYKVGFIGSTDSHTSMVSTREDNYWGKTPRGEAAADRYKHKILGVTKELETYESDTIASGLAAVWARNNTRADLYDAMEKKETYGTTGTRITVRFFGGWVDKDNKRHERIYDVAVSGGRKIGSDGRCKTPVGDTVDIDTATYLNSIGDVAQQAVWTDPNFDPALPTVYYARVLEIPTPTWQAYDQKHYGMKMPEGIPLKHQERAYTSPIWYTP